MAASRVDVAHCHCEQVATQRSEDGRRVAIQGNGNVHYSLDCFTYHPRKRMFARGPITFAMTKKISDTVKNPPSGGFLKPNLGRNLFRCVNFKKPFRREPEHPGNDAGRELFNLGIQCHHNRVVKLARGLNLGFGVGDFTL